MVLISLVPGFPNHCSKPTPWNQREQSLKNEPNVAESSIALLASNRTPLRKIMHVVHKYTKKTKGIPL